MSVRAHRVNNIEYQSATFNLWHDEKVVGWLVDNTCFFNYLTPDSYGIATVSVDNLKKLLEEVGGDIDKKVFKAIMEDIQFAEARGVADVQYYCF